MKYRALLVAFALSLPVPTYADRTERPYSETSPAVVVRAGDLSAAWLPRLDASPFAATFPAKLRGARATALASDELDENGLPDLACGYAIESGGAVAVFLANQEGAPFVSHPAVFAVPVVPDAIATGDFDNDGHRDLVVAAMGGDALVLMAGDGRGALAPPRAFPLPGRVTALAGGEVNRTDGLADLVVAVDGTAGPRLLVFEGPDGALRATPEVIPLATPASSIALGHLVGNQLGDVALGGGRELVVVVGRDRHTIAGEAGMHDVAPAAISRYGAPFEIVSLAVGDFAGDHRADVAAVGTDGALEVFAQSDDGMRPAPESARPAAPGTRRVVAARLGAPHAAAVVLDPARRELRVGAAERSVTLETARTPVAALAMRLNGDALDDLVVLHAGATAPALILTSPSAVFTVTTTADDGPGSLREAISQANAGAEPDEIRFAIGAGPQTITLATLLPEIVSPVTIDGTTQPGFAGAPLISIFGSDAVRDGLVISAGSSTVRGLAISRFRKRGETLSGRAILLDTNGGNRVEGNLVGTEIPEDESLGNSTGVEIFESGANTIGGPTPQRRNIISGNSSHGIYALSTPDNVIQNNVFGTDAAMTVAVPNNIGVLIEDGPRNRLGGTLPNEGNLALVNLNYGLDVVSLNSSENLIQGNWVGTDPSGTFVGFNEFGIGACSMSSDIEGASANFIGGTAAGAANVVTNNNIGVAIGTAPNVTAIENRILCNQIFGNARIGIDLGDDRFSFDDPGDVDAGPNVQQNAPLLTSFTVSGSNATVGGTLDSTPNLSFRIEFYSGSGRTEIGFGDGGALVATANVTTDASGSATIAVTVPLATLEGDSIVATATSAEGNTSEFGLSIALVLGWDAPDPNGGENPPPRTPSVRIDDDTPEAAPALVRGGFRGYNVYRGSTSNFPVGPGTLFQSLVPQQVVNTFAFPSGSFFRITAVYDTGESVPTPAIGGGVPPTVTSVKVKGERINVNGLGFIGPVLVFLDGFPFQSAAKLKRANTRVSQRGPLITRDKIQTTLNANAGVGTVMVRNADGGTTLRRITN